jgi:tetratricopeptide (TPR) repeat protein
MSSENSFGGLATTRADQQSVEPSESDRIAGSVFKKGSKMRQGTKKVTRAPMPRPLYTFPILLLLSGSCRFAFPQVAGPGDPLEAMFHQAQAAAHVGKYAEAEKLYRQILTEDPSILPAQVNLGLACYWQHKDREAVGELQKALRVSPREYGARLFLGLSYVDLGEYDQAQRELLDAARIKDMDSLLFWALGSLAMIHGDTNAAVPLLERAVALDPNNARAVWLLGQAYARFAYRQEEQKPLVPADYAALAQSALQWVEARQPDSALTHIFKGDVLSARKLTVEALDEYRRAQEIDPHWPDIHLMIGSLLGLLSRWDEALAELKLQLVEFPNDTRAMVEMGSVYCRSGDYHSAIPVLERALTRDRNNYEAAYRLGQAYINLGEYALAVPQLEKARQVDPQKSDPYYLLHRAYRALKQPEKAARALAEFNQLKAAGP